MNNKESELVIDGVIYERWVSEQEQTKYLRSHVWLLGILTH